MVTVISLWLPILISAVIVFIVSFILHTVFKYHQSDFRKIPREDDVFQALASIDIPPGDYIIPHSETSQERKTEEFKQKVSRGPVGFFTILPNRMPGMGKNLLLWFIYCLIVGIFAAYIAGRALESGADYMDVFRFAGTTAFAGYSLALLQESIWYYKSWSTTLKNVFDGLIYALLTAGTFGWLWP